jgi:hypothetical protein
MAPIFDIVILRNRRNYGCAACDLADALQNDLGAAVIKLDGPQNFNRSSRKMAHIAHVFQIFREDDDRERTRHLIFTEIEKVNSFGADLHADDFSRYTLRFADVLYGFMDGNAVGCGEERERKAQEAQILATAASRAAGPCPAGQPWAAVPT